MVRVNLCTMVERSRTVEPFKTLDELYFHVDNPVPWPQVTPLRETTDFVFRGLQTDDGNKKLHKGSRDYHPKTLVCHDMMGGYLEDRFIDGTDTHDAYLFYNWNYIDTFIYFSHHLVTIPPYGWVQAAHKHGVKILGTIITEHKDGEHVWRDIMRSQSTVHKFADALVQVTKLYKFDGWLLNVENQINDVPTLRYFVRYFTQKIHHDVKGSEIIWYDSVINTGSLSWQNKLNDANETFFEICDGIFLNYNWTEEGLAESAERAGRVNRMKDVYVGLDVWGRKCPGGGGFNSAHALDIIRRVGLSVAIFAPGWTHEFLGRATFHDSERIFWAQLIPMLYVHVPVYDNELFVSSFCRGIGRRQFSCGQLTNGSSFFNLSKQHIQPLFPYLNSKFDRGFTAYKNDTESNTTKEEHIYETSKEIVKVNGKVITFETKETFLRLKNHFDYSQDFSYNGGESLKFIINDINVYHRLFLVQINSHSDVQGVIKYRLDTADMRNVQIVPILVLGNNFESQQIRPSKTTDLAPGWKKSIYYTNLRSFNEIGVGFSAVGTCYLGEIIIKKRDFYSEDSTTCSESFRQF